ncbi:MAG: transcriptional regulator, CopG family [Chloroflexi bacterium]|nr:transcriptional regulator, CopG family [Chloroflexota bacterium]
MRASKVAVTIDQDLLREIDRWVSAGEFPSRSRVVQEGLARLRTERERHSSLIAELAKLDVAEEQHLAEEWLAGEADWPRF